MDGALLISVAATGFAIAFLHAALPTHWLPFVLVGRAQGWTRRRVAVVTATAGAAHVACTILLGALLVAAGVALERLTGGVAVWISALLLFALGAWYLFRHFRAGPHERLQGGPGARRYATDAAAVAALVVMLTLSPCEAFLPVFLTAAPYGVSAFLLLSLVLAVATALGMAVFTTAFTLGWDRLKLSILERYDRAILGAALWLLALAVLVLEG